MRDGAYWDGRRVGSADLGGSDEAQTLARFALFVRRRRGIDPCGVGVCVPIEVLDVRDVSAGVAKPRSEGVPNLVHGEGLALRFLRGGLGRLVCALSGPGSEGVGGHEVADGGESVVDERDGSEATAFATRHADEGNGFGEVEVHSGEPTHLGRPHAGPMHKPQPGGSLRARSEVLKDGVDMCTVDPARPW